MTRTCFPANLLNACAILEVLGGETCVGMCNCLGNAELAAFDLHAFIHFPRETSGLYTIGSMACALRDCIFGLA
jgi:hypothetical protein